MRVIKSYSSFNRRRYSDPWVAIVDPKTAKPNFTKRVGGYTGIRFKGEAGELFVTEPQDGAVYMYGQKDYRGNNTDRQYVQFKDNNFISIKPENLIKVLSSIPNKQDN